MLKKLVVASATVAAAAGMGLLATPAHANGPADVACVFNDLGKTANTTSSGIAVIGNISIADLLSNRDFYNNCDVDKQINNNHHVDSHQTYGRH
jgi:hypothetical protein